MKFVQVLLVVLFPALTQDHETKTVCPSELVKAVFSEDIVLPCLLQPWMDATDHRVEWRRGDVVVHLYQGGGADPAGQRQLEGRTSLFPEELSKGNLSLRLSSVRLTDSGTYLCCFHTCSPDTSCSFRVSVGESEVVGSHEPITAQVGGDVILPCHLVPPFDLTTLTIEWRRQGGVVHLYRSLKDHLELQEVGFKGRTSLFQQEMVHGNISLKLSNVTEDDSGNYTCFVPNLHSQVRRGRVALDVVNKSLETVLQDAGNNLSLGLGLGLGILVVIVILIKKPSCVPDNTEAVPLGTQNQNQNQNPGTNLQEGPNEENQGKNAEGPEGLESPGGLEGPGGPEDPEGPEGPEGPGGPEGPECPEGPGGPEGPEGPEGSEGPEGLESPGGPEGPEGMALKVKEQTEP